MADLGSVGQSVAYGFAFGGPAMGIAFSIPAALNIATNPPLPRAQSYGFTYSGPAMGSVFDIWSSKSIATYAIRATAKLDLFPVALVADRKTITGHVLDQTGVALARTVICVDITSNVIVDVTTSDGTTGLFTLRPPTTNLCTVFYVPTAADARNGAMLSRLVPI